MRFVTAFMLTLILALGAVGAASVVNFDLPDAPRGVAQLWGGSGDPPAEVAPASFQGNMSFPGEGASDEANLTTLSYEEPIESYPEDYGAAAAGAEPAAGGEGGSLLQPFTIGELADAMNTLNVSEDKDRYPSNLGAGVPKDDPTIAAARAALAETEREAARLFEAHGAGLTPASPDPAKPSPAPSKAPPAKPAPGGKPSASPAWKAPAAPASDSLDAKLKALEADAAKLDAFGKSGSALPAEKSVKMVPKSTLAKKSTLGTTSKASEGKAKSAWGSDGPASSGLDAQAKALQGASSKLDAKAKALGAASKK